MSTSDERKQWAEHMKDEAKELNSQQHTAGQTHSPTEGPLPYSADDLAAAVAAAMAAERQRCAEIADTWSGEARLIAAFGDLSASELQAAMATARAVGSEIRNDRGA